MEKLRTHSPSLHERNIDEIAELFPGVITEGRGADGRTTRAIDCTGSQRPVSALISPGALPPFGPDISYPLKCPTTPPKIPPATPRFRLQQ